MSIEMQQAFRNEGDDFQDAAQLASDTTEDQAGSEVIDTNFEDEQKQAENTKQDSDKNKKDRKKKTGRKSKKETKPETESETGKQPIPKFKYTCKDCGLQFDEPKIGGRGESSFYMCPELACCSKNIVEN